MRAVKTAARALWHPYCWPGWLAVAILWLYARLPHRLALAIGAAIGPLVLALLPRRRRVIAHNLALCFPEWTDAERDRVARLNRRESGRMLAAFAWGWFGAQRRVARIPVQIEGSNTSRRRARPGAACCWSAPISVIWNWPDGC